MTDTNVAEVAFKEIYPWEYTVSVLVSWNGNAAKAALQIKDGEVNYISDFESEEDRESRCCLPNDVYCSEELSDHQRGAVESLVETIRLCLCHAAEEDEERLPIGRVTTGRVFLSDSRSSVRLLFQNELEKTICLNLEK